MDVAHAKPSLDLNAVQRSNDDPSTSATLSITSQKLEAGDEAVSTAKEGEAEVEDTEYITGLKLWLVVGSLSMICFLLFLDLSIISTAIPRITSEFHSLPDVGWYSGVYQLANAALQPLTGKLYSRLNLKWNFLFFFLIFELGSLICGLAISSSMFIGGRTIAGLGGSGLMNGAMTMIAASVPLEKRPVYTGTLLGIGQMGIICGPLVGGALTEYVTWRWCFYINLPIGGLLALLLLRIHIPDLSMKPPVTLSLVAKMLPELDLIGFALFAHAAVMFLLALQLGGGSARPWNSSVVIGLFCGAAATAIVFVLWEKRMGDRAMIPGSMLRNPIMACSVGMGSFLMSTNISGATYLPIYFQGVKGVGPTMSGVYTLPGILSQLLLIVVSGALVPKLGYYLPLAVFSGGLTSIGNGLMSTLTPNTSTGKWVGYQILMGAGRGTGMQIPIIATQNALPPSQLPASMAFIIFAQNLGSAIAVVVSTTLFAQTVLSDLPRLAPSVPPQAALAAGSSAEGVRALLPPGSPELEGLLSTGGEFWVCGGWKDVRGKKQRDGEKGSV
ncbi:efflux pump protein [Pseudomassariella vexata]|uniref:Efflux pump protein n=1 Tax=Pseudomassariella vexata TaxID=1141098 RepID=A0A1Y2EHS5_9PEZI|nr:efflux pump protein [Pseudomassariella vexata]ORY70977.1 efflux pump protein [Pseudomassariella vexata]